MTDVSDLADRILDELELSIDSYAGQRAQEEIVHDPTIRALVDAAREADYRQSGRRGRIRDDKVRPIREERDRETYLGGDDDVTGYLRDARRSTEGTAEILARAVALEAVRDVEIGGYTVDLRYRRRLDCMECEEETTAYYLGDADGLIGWICGVCETTLVESRSTGTIYAREPDEDVLEEGSR